MANPSFGQQVVINFAISSKLCQDKGNILQHTLYNISGKFAWENSKLNLISEGGREKKFSGKCNRRLYPLIVRAPLCRCPTLISLSVNLSVWNHLSGAYVFPPLSPSWFILHPQSASSRRCTVTLNKVCRSRIKVLLTMLNKLCPGHIFFAQALSAGSYFS